MTVEDMIKDKKDQELLEEMKKKIKLEINHQRKKRVKAVIHLLKDIMKIRKGRKKKEKRREK